MQKIDIPIVAAGVGSQPVEGDGAELDYMRMPSEMSTFSMPLIPEPEATAELTAAKEALRDLLAALHEHRIGEPARVLDIGLLDAPNRELIDQVLGEGEVSVVYAGDSGAQIQESVLAGVWRVQYLLDGVLHRDTIEVGAIPALVSRATFHTAADAVTADLDGLPPGVQNAPALLAEINDKIAAWRAGAVPHVINLTLLPQTEQDLAFLENRLGRGPVTVLSRGYGNCRVTSTATRNVWWVQYFNSQDANILNTLEVCDVPSVACAAQQDIEDSCERLEEILDSHL